MQATLLLSGFLGAGKTTLLRALGQELAGSGIAVHAVLNDFRNAEIDAARLRDTIADLAAISGSCVCCESRDELFDTLAKLPRHEPGVVLIEANGGADPAEVVELLAWDPRCRHLAPPSVVAVVHAGRWQKRLLQRGLEREQVRPATHLLLSHAERATPARLGEVRASLGRLNPSARETDAARLAGELAALARDLSTRAPACRETPATAPTPSGSSPGTGPAATCSNAFASVELPLPRPVRRRALQAFLDVLPPQVLRAKALLQPDDSAQTLLLQRTDDGRCDWHAVAPPEGWPSTLVLIGAGLDAPALRHQLATCLDSVEG